MVEGLAALYVILIWGVLIVIPAAVTLMKGHRVIFFLGFLVGGILWIVAAMRLAKPDSTWGHRFYRGEKLRRAQRRWGDPI